MSDRRRPQRASLAGRLLTVYAVVFVILIGLFGILIRNGMVDVLEEQAIERLAAESRAIGLDLDERSGPDLRAAVAARSSALGARVTVVELDGTVIADSAFDPAEMENHAGRPELVAALGGEVGTATRRSATTGESRLYVAVPPLDGRLYRLSITDAQLAALTDDVSSRVGIAALVAGIAGVFLVAVVARRIARPIEELTEIATQVSDGQLDATPRSSSVEELDRLGHAIGRMSSELGNRIREAQAEADTLQALLDALPQGVLLVSADDVVVFGNQTAASLLGEIPTRVGRLTPVGLQRLVRGAADGRETVQREFDYGGAGPTIRAVAAPLPDDSVLLVLNDVTAQLRVEAMRRDFVADASHELKTPVSSILAASETMRMALERDPDRALGFLRSIEGSAQHLARLVEDLLDLSRLEASVPERHIVRVDEVIIDEIERRRPSATDAGVTMDHDVHPATVEGSAADLALAIGNLIQNAIRYSESGDRVVISTTSEAGAVRVSVVDTGVGIPQRSLGRVFERFYRVDVARSRETGGTGLGLAIVKHVAESHGGSVSVESELGAGSTFHLVLPTVGAERPEVVSDA